jgi:hypothetical protein
MPLLDNARHEAFAQAGAKGVRMEDAYEDAGFAPGNGHASRFAGRPAILARIAELRAQQTDIAEAGAHAVIAALLRVAKAGEATLTPAAIKEVRPTLLAIDRLRENLELDRDAERRGTIRKRNP